MNHPGLDAHLLSLGGVIPSAASRRIIARASTVVALQSGEGSVFERHEREDPLGPQAASPIPSKAMSARRRHGHGWEPGSSILAAKWRAIGGGIADAKVSGRERKRALSGIPGTHRVGAGIIVSEDSHPGTAACVALAAPVSGHRWILDDQDAVKRSASPIRPW